MSLSGVKLYGYWRSSSAWRVRIGLAYKAIPYELVPVHLLRDGGEQLAPAFVDKSPLAQVPLVEIERPDGTFRLTQSMAILEYLEEVAPDPPLLPALPEQRARARELAEMVNAGIQPLQNLKTLRELKAAGVDPHAVARGFIEAGLSALERRARETAGRYLVGDALSLADVYAVPELYVARRFGVELEPFPTLLRVERECEALPAFQTAHPSAQPDRDRDA